MLPIGACGVEASSHQSVPEATRRVKLVPNIQIIYVNTVCKWCWRTVFTNTFVLNAKKTLQELAGRFVMTTDFKAGL